MFKSVCVFAGTGEFIYKEFRAFLVASAFYLCYYKILWDKSTTKRMLHGFLF